MIDVIVVNLNCLEHTKNLISDLARQSYTRFNLTILDQNSIETGTVEWLEEMLQSELKPNVIRHNTNVPLNLLWNLYVTTSEADAVCLLNNDIRIPANFLQDVSNILEVEPNVGAVMHPTNHPDYAVAMPVTEYDILDRGEYRQGWDICIRPSAWTMIPDSLTFYCGDDFVFQNMYDKGFDAAMVVSSPIIHYLGQTRKSKLNGVIPGRDPDKDITNYKAMGYTHHMGTPDDYTVVHFDDSDVEEIKELLL